MKTMAGRLQLYGWDIDIFRGFRIIVKTPRSNLHFTVWFTHQNAFLYVSITNMNGKTETCHTQISSNGFSSDPITKAHKIEHCIELYSIVSYASKCDQLPHEVQKIPIKRSFTLNLITPGMGRSKYIYIQKSKNAI